MVNTLLLFYFKQLKISLIKIYELKGAFKWLMQANRFRLAS